ncbi:MAG: hypothetical protein EOM91_04310 [Sphingobacteriia bacterium]|nr:hypothetical protein [Sphingobacteriia bacterium]NCC39625.1 hypothetical protein [Gammaproteobacteria bacterium]
MLGLATRRPQPARRCHCARSATHRSGERRVATPPEAALIEAELAAPDPSDALAAHPSFTAAQAI